MAKTLDLAFTIDCTASMSKYIVEAQQSISRIVNAIATNGGFKVRFGLVEYRDHPPQKQGFITRPNGFTTSLTQMCQWLDRCAQIKDGVPADMCFVLDASGSIGSPDFEKEKQFVTGVVNALKISPDMVQVGVVKYSTSTKIELSLNSCSNTYNLQSQVRNIRYTGGNTNTGSAIEVMTNLITDTRAGARTLVQKIGIVLTDGGSNSHEHVKNASRTAKQKEIRMLSIGVGDGVNEAELHTIASSDNLVYRVDNFSALEGIKKQILTDAIQGVNDGADEPEAVEDGLYETKRLDWQSDTRMCVLIADQPPHGLCGDQHDNYPNGCPDKHDPMEIANDLAEKGVSIYVIGCEPSICPYKDFFMAIAKMTGGLYIPLADANSLSQVIIGAAQEEISLRENMNIVENFIKDEYAQNNQVVDEESVSFKLFEMLKGTKTKQLKLNGGSLPEVSPKAKRFARFPNIMEIKKKFIPGPRTSSQSAGATFTIEEKDIELLQVQRMVQKAIMINGMNN